MHCLRDLLLFDVLYCLKYVLLQALGVNKLTVTHWSLHKGQSSKQKADMQRNPNIFV